MRECESNDCCSCYLKESCIFNKTGLADQKELQEALMTFHFKKGQTVFLEGDKKTGIYFVKNGKLKCIRNVNDDHEVILKLLKEGDMLGHSLLTSQNLKYEFTAISLGNSQLCYIPYLFAKRHLEDNLALIKTISLIYYQDLLHYGNIILNINSKNVRERIANSILELRQTFGLDQNGTIDIAVTREEIANMSATTTESAIRFISEFKQENLIKLDNKKIQIVNLAKLQKIAGK